MNKLLFIDTETGGLDPNLHSLLSIGLVVWENKKIIDSKEIFIKRKEYKTTEEAMLINKINLEELSENGVNLEDARDETIKFIKKYFENEKITLAGHNVNFDVLFFKQLFDKDFFDYFSYRSLDTASILKFFSIKGTFKKELNSLDDAIKYFNINIEKRHSALDDILATAKIFNELLLL